LTRPLRTTTISLAIATLVAVAGSAVSESAAPAAELLAGVTLASSSAVGTACPCSGPAVGGIWRNHGQYVSCVTQAARQRARAAELTVGDARAIIRDGARSACGRASDVTGNVRVCAQSPSLPCRTVRSARVDDCSECTAALEGRLVHCARVASRSGEEREVCATTAPRLRASGERIVEHRTGVDCASCKAKLGTPAAEGLDCIVARCDAFGG
jgi:hypothetical protein